jgi:membrane protein implicated in regulation of membrane protease activity
MAYFEYYQMAWAVYLIAAVLLMFVWFRLTKNMQAGDRQQYVRLIPAVLLFTPAVNDQALAPAFIVTLGELLTNGVQSAMMGIVPLLVTLLLGAIALAIYSLFKPKPVLKQND